MPIISSGDVVNPRKSQRLSSVANFTERTPDWLVALAMRTKKILGIERWEILDALRRWNVRRESRQAMDRALRREIRATYSDDVQRLSTLIGRDLDHWVNPQPSGSDSEMGTRLVGAT